jgi:catechol 2,3-dioxygenase-like lactoylglutathione lyase family enzyme
MVFLELVLQAFSVSAERAFYGDTLGFAVVTATPDEVVFQVGEARVAFRSAPNGTSPTYHIAFEVPPNQFRAAKAWLAERVPLLREDSEDEFTYPLEAVLGGVGDGVLEFTDVPYRIRGAG